MTRRLLRGILGTTLVWAACWALLGLVLGVGTELYHHLRPGAPPLLLAAQFVRQAVVLWGTFGAVAGFLFALMLRAGSRRVADLSGLTFRRVAGSGAGGGFALAVGLLALVGGGTVPPLAALLAYIVGGAVLGGGMAAGGLAVARRVPSPFELAGGMPRLEPLSNRDDG